MRRSSREQGSDALITRLLGWTAESETTAGSTVPARASRRLRSHGAERVGWIDQIGRSATRDGAHGRWGHAERPVDDPGFVDAAEQEPHALPVLCWAHTARLEFWCDEGVEVCVWGVEVS